ncbi:hypothetical protein ABZ615_33310 [Streptomyces sp. NPDC007325]|uniref:hypothetical protein n=1 Tax=Streptomyces sp. NPDC007325 TaxID=3154588 RepID=UPI0033F70FF9
MITSIRLQDQLQQLLAAVVDPQPGHRRLLDGHQPSLINDAAARRTVAGPSAYKNR